MTSLACTSYDFSGMHWAPSDPRFTKHAPAITSYGVCVCVRQNHICILIGGDMHIDKVAEFSEWTSGYIAIMTRVGDGSTWGIEFHKVLHMTKHGVTYANKPVKDPKKFGWV